MVHHPMVYAKLLGEKIQKHNAQCWLVNTGWTGGPYGVGKRIKISYTRAMVEALLNGSLDNATFEIDPVFGFQTIQSCPEVPSEVLRPRSTWPDPTGYDEQIQKLAGLFIKNFEKYKEAVPSEVIAAGPRL